MPLQNASVMNITVSIPLLTAFVQGLLSFFSPCVLPLLPVYLTWLAGGAGLPESAAPGTGRQRARLLLHSLCFTLGISAALILLGMTFTALGQFLHRWQRAVQMIGGLLVILFGLIQLGVLGKTSVLQREYRLPLKLEKLRMNPAAAFLMGLCFSFSWTPCIGPTLSGILMTAATAATRERGMMLMAAYIVGFILPFVAVGLFTGSVLSFFRKHRGVVRWTGIVSGVLLVVMGVLLMTGTFSGWSSWVASASAEEAAEAPAREESEADSAAESEDVEAPDFTLRDQYGVEHTLSQYRGKVVFLNFWATWCPWCVKEMPDIEALYHELGENQEDVVFLGLASPLAVDNVDEAGIISFLEEHGWTYPVLMDETGELFQTYYAQSLPTTWLIRKDGMVMGYVPGAMSKDQMQEVIRMTAEYDSDKE